MGQQDAQGGDGHDADASPPADGLVHPSAVPDATAPSPPPAPDGTRPNDGRVPWWIGVAAVLGAFGLAAAAFAVPAARADPGWDTEAYRYTWLVDGTAALTRTTASNGDLLSWSSSSVSLLPGLKALGDLPRGFEDAVARQITGQPDAGADDALADLDAIRDARVLQIGRRTLTADASLETRTEIVVADAAGITTLGSAPVGAPGDPVVFEPGILLVPADPTPGRTWAGRGTFGVSSYAWEGEVVERTAYDGPLGRFDDCIVTSGTLTLSAPEQDTQETTFTDTWCAGTGIVRTVESGDGDATYERVASLDARGDADLAPAAAPGGEAIEFDATAGPGGRPTEWGIRRAGSIMPVSGTATSTFSPVYVPSDPPVVVAAAESTGDLVAMGTGDRLGSVQWSIATDGAPYSRPRWDERRRRLYVGASDGYVRAIDARGLFLWAARAGDAVPGTPVVAGDTVVFGSEDGTIRGVDADTGEETWRVDATAPVVSGGAVLDDMVVVADTAGVVHALDPDDGAERWALPLDASVEASLTEAPAGVLVADRSGHVSLVDGKGAVLWTTNAALGWAVRWQPTVVGDLVVVVDESGRAAAIGLADGEVAWRRGTTYSGAPAADGDRIVLATELGEVVVLGPDGARQQRMAATDARATGLAQPSFTYGPATGGGLLWLSDDAGTVWAVGAGGNGAEPLAAAWSKTTLDAPYEKPMVSTPVPDGDRLLATDIAQRLLAIDPTDGTATLLGTFGQEGDQAYADPVLAGDVLLVDLGVRLVAIDPDDASVRWQVPVSGTRSLPPTVAGDVAVTVSATAAGAELIGIDVATGTVLWRRSTGGAALTSGGVAAEDGTVLFAGAPVEAIDPTTGRPLWTSDVPDPNGGLATDGDVVVVPTYVQGAESGGLAVIDAASGETLWARITEGQGAGPSTRILLADDTIVLGSVVGAVLGFDLADGTETWRRELTGALLGTASLLDAGIVYALENGQVSVLEPATGEPVAAFEGLGTDIGATSIAQHPVSLGGTITVVAGQILFAVEAPA